MSGTVIVNPVSSIIYDEDGNKIGVVLDGITYRLQVEAKLKTGHGLSTENKQDSILTVLSGIDNDTNKLDVNLSTRATEFTLSGLKTTTDLLYTELQQKTEPNDLQKTVLYNSLGNAVGIVLDNTVYRLQVDAKLTTGHGLATEITASGILEDLVNKNIPQYRLQSGSYPDPSSYDTTESVDPLIDAYGNIQVRSTVLTDETSFRDDFSSNTLVFDLTGTITLNNTSTSVTGVGTLFTEEIKIGDYIRLSSDINSTLTQVSYIIDDTSLELTENYLGTSGSGSGKVSNWGINIAASPSSTSVSSSILSITNSTVNGALSYIERAADYLPFVLTAYISVSQRITNQELFIGFRDDCTSPEKEASFIWDGTDNRILKCRSSFSSDSIEESEITLPGELVTDSNLVYQIELTPNQVTFLVDGIKVASHQLHLPGPYDVLELCTGILNTGTTSSNTTMNIDSVFFQNTDQVQTGNIFKGEPQAVQGVTGGVPITIQFGNPGGGTSLPRMVNIVYNKSDGAIVANAYKRVQTYTIPTGYNGYIIRFVSFQGEAAASRCVAETNFGSFNNSTQVWTSSSSYTVPQWAGVIQAEVTTAIQAGSGSVTVTVGYTNNTGTAGRTGTITIPRGALVGARYDLALQSGDLGVQSIQTVTSTPTVTGVFKIIGLLQLSVHQDQSTTTQTETLFAPGAITFPPNTTIGIEYAGGTVSKSRLFDTLIQLVQA
jgi:hypothetical protein